MMDWSPITRAISKFYKGNDRETKLYVNGYSEDRYRTIDFFVEDPDGKTGFRRVDRCSSEREGQEAYAIFLACVRRMQEDHLPVFSVVDRHIVDPVTGERGDSI